MLELRIQNQNLHLRSDLRYRSFQFSLDIISFVRNFPSTKLYFIFQDQLLRAATSIGANIIEAKASSSRKDFIRYYEIALKSANESIYWLTLLRDGKLISITDVQQLIKEATEISNMLGSSLLTLKGKKLK